MFKGPVFEISVWLIWRFAFLHNAELRNQTTGWHHKYGRHAKDVAILIDHVVGETLFLDGPHFINRNGRAARVICARSMATAAMYACAFRSAYFYIIDIARFCQSTNTEPCYFTIDS